MIDTSRMESLLNYLQPEVTPWSIDTFCKAQQVSDVTTLPLDDTARDFVAQLGLSVVHPFCHESTAPHPYHIEGIPPQGPLLHHDHLETLTDVFLAVFFRTVPSLLAMGELWLRLFASLIAPLGIAHLMADWIRSLRHAKDQKSKGQLLSIVCLLTMASATILSTDTLYVLEYGPHYGIMLWLVAMIVSVVTALRYRLRGVLVGQGCLFLLTFVLIYDFETGHVHFGGHPDDQQVRIEEGLYYNVDNPQAQRIVDRWPHSYRRYDFDKVDPLRIGATQWMPTGDSRTGLPFILNKVASPYYVRVWLPVSDGEVIALDIAFPPLKLSTSSDDQTIYRHDTSKPLYMILHGLNGGSQEEYVKDFAVRRHAEGSTVVVVVARGLMDLPIRGWDGFHGARITDAHAAATALRSATAEGQILAGVGYSMGAIILSNYVARSGSDCALHTAVSISGGLDMRYETNFTRAQRLWQPILTQELREKFVLGKFGEKMRQRLSKQQMKEMLRAYHITEIDKTAVVAYNGFRDLDHYYSDMSALGDTPLEFHSEATAPAGTRIHNITIPICVIHALDDPLISWRTVAANGGLMHPENLTKTGAGNLFLLLTKRGG